MKHQTPTWGHHVPQQSGYWQSPLWSFKDLTNQTKKKGKIYNACQVSSLCSFLPGESFPLPSSWVSNAQLSQPNLSQSGVLARTKLTHFPSLYGSYSLGHSFFVANAWLLYAASYCVPGTWHSPSLIPTTILQGEYCQAQRGWGHSHEHQITYNKLFLLKDRDYGEHLLTAKVSYAKHFKYIISSYHCTKQEILLFHYR